MTMAVSNHWTMNWILFTLLLWPKPGHTEERPLMQITTTIDFGQDVGQNWGSLFEARDPEGRVVMGAGFAGVYNTAFRMDRFTLQFFLRDDEAEETFEALPPSTEDGGSYLFDLDGRVYSCSYHQDRTARWWDDEAGRWQVDESFGVGETVSGDGKMRVAGKIFQFKGGEAWYDGERILGPPASGRHHHFYYALGYLTFFHKDQDSDPPYTRLYAVPWKPGDGPVDLEKAVTLDLKYPQETPFSIGQLGDEIVNSSNMGGVYVFDGSKWKIVRASLAGVSFQLYSMLNWYDEMLIAQYPTGNLFRYDGKALRHLEDAPPVMPGVSGSAREAQSTAIYGGDLYVGVWPWSELWRYDAHGHEWKFVRRNFRKPPITDRMTHPYEDRVVAYNEEHGTDLVINDWGQRVTGLAPNGDAMFLSVSAKGCPVRDMRHSFLHDDEVWNQYRMVYRVRKPGSVSVPVAWTEEPTTIEFAIDEEKISIAQDGRNLGSAPVPAGRAGAAMDADIRWGHGMFGPLRAKMRSNEVE